MDTDVAHGSLSDIKMSDFVNIQVTSNLNVNNVLGKKAGEKWMEIQRALSSKWSS